MPLPTALNGDGLQRDIVGLELLDARVHRFVERRLVCQVGGAGLMSFRQARGILLNRIISEVAFIL